MRKLIGLTIAILVAGASILHPTTLRQLTLQQLTQASTAIIRGHPIAQESRWNDAHTEIDTFTTFAVESVVKGKVGQAVVVKQPGGTVGNFHVRVPGVVHFVPEASYVLFLEPSRDNPARYLVVGMMEGAYRIYRDPQTGEERVIRPFGSALEGAGGGLASEETLPLRSFQERLQSAMARSFTLPATVSLPVVIRSAAFRGVGRMEVRAQTTAAIYPDATTLIPAGSVVEGTAVRHGSVWMIHWMRIFIRGQAADISAHSEVMGRLQGQATVAREVKP
jgi:hypothetical protein